MKLLEACELIVDCPHSTAKDEGEGYPLIRTPNIGRGRLMLDNVHRVSESVYHKRNERAIPQENDLILAREAPVGNVALIRHGQKVCLGQRTVLIRPNSELVDPEFLVYYLLSPGIQHVLLNSANGATVSHLNMSDIRKLDISLPPLNIQRRIGRTISILDDKISINTEINQNLSEQAEALYLKFFSPKSGTHGIVVTLDEYCDIFTGKKNANASVEGGKYKFFTCAPESLLIDSYIYDGNAIIVSGNGAYTGRTRFYSGKFDLYQRTYACTLLDGINPDFIFPLYWFVKLELSKKIIGGTRGSAIPYIVMNDLAKFEFIYNEEVFAVNMPIFKSLTEAIQINEIENEHLSNLRDTILPKLMSGELDVSELEI